MSVISVSMNSSFFQALSSDELGKSDVLVPLAANANASLVHTLLP